MVITERDETVTDLLKKMKALTQGVQTMKKRDDESQVKRKQHLMMALTVGKAKNSYFRTTYKED